MRLHEGYLLAEAERHQQEDRGCGCTCGFCVWSVEHVVVMAARGAADLEARLDREAS